MDAETALQESKVVDEVVTTGMKLKTALRKFGMQHYTSKGSHRNGYNRVIFRYPCSPYFTYVGSTLPEGTTLWWLSYIVNLQRYIL